jgi:hypothetical protein
LLSALSLVVLLNKRLVSVSRHEEIGSERVDPEHVLERMPSGIVWAAI